MTRLLTVLLCSYCLLLTSWSPLAQAQTKNQRPGSERRQHQSSVGSESGLPVGGRQGNAAPAVGLPAIKGMQNNDPRTIEVNANQGTVTNSTIQTERYLSTLVVIVTMAIVGSSTLYCNKIFEAFSWDITDYYLAIGGAIAAIFAEIYTFGMYQGMVYSNFKIGASDDDRKLTDEQRDALIQEKEMLASTKHITEMRTTLFGAAAAMFYSAAAIAGAKALAHYGGIAGCMTGGKAISTPNFVACKAEVKACTAAGAATAGVVSAACESAGESICTGCQSALINDSNWEKVAMSLADMTFKSEIYAQKASTVLGDWLKITEPACVAGHAGVFNVMAAAHVKGCQLVKEAIASNLITCHEPPESVYLKQDSIPGRAPFFSTEHLIKTAHAQLPGMDLMGMVSKAFIPSNKDAGANKVAKGGSIAGGLVLGGVLTSTASIIKILKPQLWRFVDTLMGHSLLRSVLYTVLGGMLSSVAAYNFTVIRPNLDEEIRKINDILLRFGEAGQLRPKVNPVVNIPFNQVTALELQEALDSDAPALLPCPAGGDGKGNCNEVKNDEAFLLQGPDFLSQSKTSSQDATRLTNALVSKKSPGQQGLRDSQSLAGALKKLKSENQLLRKKLQEQVSKSGAPPAFLDQLEKDIVSRFNAIAEKATGSGIALDQNTTDFVVSAPTGSGAGQEATSNGLKARAQLPSSDKPDWDVKYDYSEPSQDQELASLTAGEGFQAGAQSDISEMKEENIFNQITLRYFKSAYPIIFTEIK